MFRSKRRRLIRLTWRSRCRSSALRLVVIIRLFDSHRKPLAQHFGKGSFLSASVFRPTAMEISFNLKRCVIEPLLRRRLEAFSAVSNRTILSPSSVSLLSSFAIDDCRTRTAPSNRI